MYDLFGAFTTQKICIFSVKGQKSSLYISPMKSKFAFSPWIQSILLHITLI